jgi:hypothetical protein
MTTWNKNTATTVLWTKGILEVPLPKLEPRESESSVDHGKLAAVLGPWLGELGLHLLFFARPQLYCEQGPTQTHGSLGPARQNRIRSSQRQTLCNVELRAMASLPPLSAFSISFRNLAVDCKLRNITGGHVNYSHRKLRDWVVVPSITLQLFGEGRSSTTVSNPTLINISVISRKAWDLRLPRPPGQAARDRLGQAQAKQHMA